MGWIEKKPIHYCDVPRNNRKRDWGVGSLWMCDECGTEYEWSDTFWAAEWIVWRPA